MSGSPLVRTPGLFSRSLAWWYLPPLRGHVFSPNAFNALLAPHWSYYQNSRSEDAASPTTWEISNVCAPFTKSGTVANLGVRECDGFLWAANTGSVSDSRWTSPSVWFGDTPNWHMTLSFWLHPFVIGGTQCIYRNSGTFGAYLLTNGTIGVNLVAAPSTGSETFLAAKTSYHVIIGQGQYNVSSACNVWVNGKNQVTYGVTHQGPGGAILVDFLGDAYNQSLNGMIRDVRLFKAYPSQADVYWLYQDALRGHDTQMLHQQSKRRSYFSPVAAAATSGQRIFGGGWGGRVIAQMKEAA